MEKLVARPSLLALSGLTSAIVAGIVLLGALAVVGANRLPVLFPDTMAYSSAGEASFGAMFGRHHRQRNGPAPAGSPAPAAPAAVPAAPVAPPARGVSEARSPFYGVFLAFLDRCGGVETAAAAQAVLAAAVLVVALRRLRLDGGWAVATAAVAVTAGLGFFAVALVPDVFLGVVILALAFLLSDRSMSRRSRLFWGALLLAGLLFHRSFLAVALVVVVGALPAWRAPWLARRGWLVAAAACGIALVGHAAVPVLVERVYGGTVASPPFLLARMIEGRVVPAYLADACPRTPYYLCRVLPRLPMDHDQFLWDTGPRGVFNTLSVGDRQRVVADAGPIVTRAIAARPLLTATEALRYAVTELVFAGMDDFSERLPLQWGVDPAFAPAIAAYPLSGIVVGDFPLHAVSQVTQVLYLAAWAALVAATAALLRPELVGRRRTATLDRPLLAAAAIIVSGIVVNAAVSGVLSGLRDRYSGRVAWLAVVVAAAILAEVARTTSPARNEQER